MVRASRVVVSVTGVRPTIVMLDAQITSLAVRAEAGLLAAGRVVQARARANMATRHYRGRAERATTVEVHNRSPLYMSVTVGIHGNTFAPEGKTFEVGWRSERGLQPPVAPLALWALERGLAHTESEAKSIAFVIARMQARRGYSFGEFHWLTDAWNGEEMMVEGTVARYLAASWASQARIPAGQSGGGRFLRTGA